MTGGDLPEWKFEEWECIKTRRARAFGGPRETEEGPPSNGAGPKNLVGLSLSGGGIRSAIYNDGFLQGLSHRGFLRYVDYMCSVSGGGYIAGHLVSQVRHEDDDEEKCFHDDKGRRNLGRDPITGEVCPRRLAGVGGYLSRTMEFLPAYLWSFFFSFAFYIGIVGIVATLAALFWRSFDDPVFRSLYSGTLDLIRGSELTIAFIPAILLAVLATVSEVGLSIWRLLFGFERLLPRKIHLIVRKVSLILVVLAIITSMAIFIGNGKTSVSSNAGGELLLNHYAHWLAISAGIIQILLFLGKDRLFRSERAEAKQWQKHLQRSVTTFVLLFLIFAMVHWMGREDISGYTQNRDPHLVRGDVTDWYLLDELFATYEARLRKKSTTGEPQHLNPLDNVPAFAKPPSRWTAFLVAGRTGLGVDNWHNDEELAHPPSPLQTKGGAEDAWSLAKRIRGACVAYSFAMFKAVPENPKEYRESKPDSVTKFVGEAFENVHFAYALQDKRLTLWNKYLQDSQFTSFLIDGNKDDVEPATPSEPPALNATQPDRSLTSTQTDSRDILVSAQLKNLLDSIGGKLTDAERSSLVKTVRSSTVADGQPQEIKDLSSQRLATATANRQLLNVLFPGAVQDPRVASTLVVPPHDQAARKRWLCLWTVLTLVGMIGGLGQNHIATVFQFYRQQLGSNFLVATHDRSQQYCDKQLYELNPTDDGLPFPLFLAATLEPTTCNGSYRIEAKPFVFSPLYCGHFDTDEGLIPSKQLSFSSSPASVAVTLGDAITLSGAAVTPLMTGNRWLSIILDFFNTGIGQRLRRLDRTGRELRRQWSRPIVMSAIVMLLAAIIAHFLIGLNVIMVFVIAVLTCLACYCIVLRIGSLGLITSLFFPRNRDFAKMARADGRSFYVADGGFYDYLGVTELLRRRCELIVVSDTGANIGDDPLGTLAQMCEKASQELGVRFLDLDHEAPIDFGRLKQTEKRLVHQPYLCMRVRYPDPNRPEGRLFYCQMSITDSDPIEIQNIRNRFPSFPDEPTVNQFYSDEQVSAYRALGYHIGNRLCNELQSWQVENAEDAGSVATDPPQGGDPAPVADSPGDPQPSPQVANLQRTESKSRPCKMVEKFRQSLVAGRVCLQSHEASFGDSSQGQPLFDILIERMLTAYRLACYVENSYRKDDIFSEAIWVSRRFAFPAFRGSVQRVIATQSIDRHLADRWLLEYELSADVRSAYRTAVIRDINEMNDEIGCFCEVLWSEIVNLAGQRTGSQRRLLLTAHLASIAIACQEIHSGRPHSTFQIGGREKLVQLCDSFSKAICEELTNKSTKNYDPELLFGSVDQMIAELIELERSVFQGGEHVTTVSFAQCMSTMWGRITRARHRAIHIEDDVCKQMASVLKGENWTHHSATPLVTDFHVTELRHRLDIGLRRARVRFIRDALVKCWCIGYLEPAQIQAEFDDRFASPADPTNELPTGVVEEPSGGSQES